MLEKHLELFVLDFTVLFYKKPENEKKNQNEKCKFYLLYIISLLLKVMWNKSLLINNIMFCQYIISSNYKHFIFLLSSLKRSSHIQNKINLELLNIFTKFILYLSSLNKNIWEKNVFRYPFLNYDDKMK